MVFPALHSFSFSDSFLFKKQTAYNMFLKKVFIKIKTFLGGHRTCRILVPCSGIKPAPHALEVWCLNHWTTREILNSFESTSIPTLPSLPHCLFYSLSQLIYCSSASCFLIQARLLCYLQNAGSTQLPWGFALARPSACCVLIPYLYDSLSSFESLLKLSFEKRPSLA